MLVQLVDPKDGSGDLILPLGEDLCDQLGWDVDDVVVWTPNDDGSFTVSKKETETELVMVETISTFRLRYVVEVPKGKAAWAEDTVACNEAEELGQKHLTETIVSHRVVTLDEARQLALEDCKWMTDAGIDRSIKKWDDRNEKL